MQGDILCNGEAVVVKSDDTAADMTPHSLPVPHAAKDPAVKSTNKLVTFHTSPCMHRERMSRLRDEWLEKELRQPPPSSTVSFDGLVRDSDCYSLTPILRSFSKWKSQRKKCRYF